MARRASLAHVDTLDHKVPWVPEVLGNVPPEVLHRLTYVVLDEREADGDLSFVLTPWPHLDQLGRVRHQRDKAVVVAINAAQWQDLMEQRREPEVLRERAPKIGDAFAVMMARRSRRDLLAPRGPIVDVTADARDAARAALYGAIAPPLPDAAEEAEHERAHHVVVPVPPEWEASS